MTLNLDAMWLAGLTALGVAALLLPPLAGAVKRARKEGEQREEAERARSDACLANVADGMLLVNEGLRVVRANPVAEKAGFRAGQSLARQGEELQLPDDEHEDQGRQACGEGCGPEPQLVRKMAEAAITGARVKGDAEVSVMRALDGAARAAKLHVSCFPVAVRGVPHAALIWRDVTEERALREKLSEALLDKERLDAEIRCSTIAKGQFFAGMSHEIRTPLNGIIGMSGLLADTTLSRDQREYVDDIRRSSEALLVVMNDILDITRLEGNKVEFEHELFDLQYCVEEAIAWVMPAALKKRLEIICNMDESLRSLWVGDVGRLRQILVNVLDNAIKFTERGEVSLSVSGASNGDGRYRLDFAVKDTGVGIPPDRQRALFTPFDPEGAAARGHRGLGLAVSRRICEHMGGQMSVESRGVPGQGSVFRFWVLVQASSDVKTPTVNVSRRPLEGRRVLVVDDNASSREQLSRTLGVWDMRVESVASASGAMDWLRGDTPFDVLLLDYEMPHMNGLKLAEAIRGLPNRQGIRIILLSPLGDRVTGGDRTLVDDCLCKPAAPNRLMEALFKALRVSASRPEGGDTMDGHSDIAASHPLKILIAEDNVVNQKVAVNLLRKCGYTADVVPDGLEAVDAVKRKAYDLVLMDVQMPSLDGEQATIRIRKELPDERQPWIVAMTANVMKGDRERYLGDGMNNYIAKPIRMEQLRDVLLGSPSLATRQAAREEDPDKEMS